MYTDHYGLSDRPFQLTPDPRFYFESATHRKAMAYLGYGLAQGEGFIVITGDIGSGKTTLVKHLMETIDTTRMTAISIVSTQVEGDDMLRLVAQALHIATEGVEKAQILARIEKLLDDQARSGRPVLIIVDEAQNLPVSALEELRMLSNHQRAGRSLVQIFLLGQPEFRERLEHAPELEQLRQRVIATHHLEPMLAGEVELYVNHRLAQVGWAGNPAFTADAFTALHDVTDGVPRKINTLMTRILLHGALDQLRRIDRAVVKAVVDDRDADRSPAPNVRPDPFKSQRGPIGIVSSTHGHFDAEAQLHAEARLAALETRVEEQERALRRVLALLVDWVEGDAARPERPVSRTDAA